MAGPQDPVRRDFRRLALFVSLDGPYRSDGTCLVGSVLASAPQAKVKSGGLHHALELLDLAAVGESHHQAQDEAEPLMAGQLAGGI